MPESGPREAFGDVFGNESADEHRGTFWFVNGISNPTRRGVNSQGSFQSVGPRHASKVS